MAIRKEGKDPDFVSLMVKKSREKDNVAKPDSLMGSTKRDPTLKANYIDSDVKEIEEITKKLKEKIK